jgi:hypothetical protein
MEHIEPRLNLFEKSRTPDPRKRAYTRYLLGMCPMYWVQFRNAKDRFSTPPSVFKLQRDEGLFERVVDDRGKRRRKHGAPEHTLTVMAGSLALAKLLQSHTNLKIRDLSDLITAAAVHDVNKDIEFQATRMTIKNPDYGFGLKGYDFAGTISTQKLRFVGTPERIIKLHDKVGHASCPETEKIVDGKTNIDPNTKILTLILHYVDDITTNPNIIDPTITFDETGNRLNALDRRCIQNEKNSNYVDYNNAWKEDPRNNTGETAFGMQRRIGHKVEKYLADILGLEDSLILPLFISLQMEEDVLTHWQTVHPAA